MQGVPRPPQPPVFPQTEADEEERLDPFPWSDSDDIALPEGYKPTKYDIINGRGRKSYNHVANRRFRKMIKMNLERYKSAIYKVDKTFVVVDIVSSIRKSSPCGAFIKFNVKRDRWISLSDESAREKVGHCLRDMIASRIKAGKDMKGLWVPRSVPTMGDTKSATPDADSAPYSDIVSMTSSADPAKQKRQKEGRDAGSRPMGPGLQQQYQQHQQHQQQQQQQQQHHPSGVGGQSCPMFGPGLYDRPQHAGGGGRMSSAQQSTIPPSAAGVAANNFNPARWGATPPIQGVYRPPPLPLPTSVASRNEFAVAAAAAAAAARRSHLPQRQSPCMPRYTGLNTSLNTGVNDKVSFQTRQLQDMSDQQRNILATLENGFKGTVEELIETVGVGKRKF